MNTFLHKSKYIPDTASMKISDAFETCVIYCLFIDKEIPTTAYTYIHTYTMTTEVIPRNTCCPINLWLLKNICSVLDTHIFLSTQKKNTIIK